MDTTLREGLARITEVIMFENWLRFYFIAEEGDALLLRLPEKTMQRLHTDYPDLAGLAEELNNQEVDHQRSVNAVCLYVAGKLDGTVLPETATQQLFDSPALHFELNLFSTWVQNHEEQLDAAFTTFADWQKLYAEWKSSEQVQEYIASLKRTAGPATGPMQ